MPRPTAPPVNKIPLNKFDYAKSRVTMLETAATNAAHAAGLILSGGINPANLLAAEQAAYDAAIAAGATDFEANAIAKGAVQSYVAHHKLSVGMTETQLELAAAIAGLAAVGAAAATMDDPCNLAVDGASMAAACISALDVASVKLAIQFLRDNNG